MNKLKSNINKILCINSSRSWDIRIAALTGHLNAALLYGQINHHYTHLGSFSKSNSELAKEVNLSLWEFKNAKKVLIEKDIIHIRNGSKNRTIYSIVKKFLYCEKSYRMYNTNYCLINNDKNSGILLGQLIYLMRYFLREGKNEFFKTNESLMKDLHLSEWELKKSKNILLKNGFISVSIGQYGRTYYKIHQDIIEKAIRELTVGWKPPAQCMNVKVEPNLQRSWLETSSAVGWKPPAQLVGNLQHNIYSNIYKYFLYGTVLKKTRGKTECEEVSLERKKGEKINKKEQPMNTSNQLIKQKERIMEEEEEITHSSKDIYTMVGIWKENVYPETIMLSSRVKDALQFALTKKFDNSLDKWKDYCSEIASDSWLMGKNDSGWKVQLMWAINPERIEERLAKSALKNSLSKKGSSLSITLIKEDLIDEILESTEDYFLKKIKVTLIDFMYKSYKHVGLLSYHTYLRRAKFEVNQRGDKSILIIKSSYGAYAGLLCYTEIMINALSSFDEVIIFGGTNDRSGNRLYLPPKSETSIQRCPFWEKLAVERGVESIISISPSEIVNSYPCTQTFQGDL